MAATQPLTGTGSRILDDIAEVIGEEAAYALAWQFKGERVYLPKDHMREPRLAETVGEAVAVRLCEAFFGTVVTFPYKVILERKVAELAADPSVTKRQIAQRLGIREARVYAILARIRDDRQLDLF